MKPLQLGLNLDSLGMPIRSALTSAANLGLSGVRINATGDLAPGRLSASGRREFRNLLRSFQLDLTALNCPIRRSLDTADDLQPRIEVLQQAMQLAYDLGCGKIIVPLPKLSDDAASPKAVLLRDALLSLASHGDHIGTLVAVEPGLDPGERVSEYLDTFDTGCLKVNFDPANFLLNGFDPIASLTALAGKVIHADARDGLSKTVSGSGSEARLGEGEIDWTLLIATLEATGYRGYLTVDREQGENRAADIAAGVRYLRRAIPLFQTL